MTQTADLRPFDPEESTEWLNVLDDGFDLLPSFEVTEGLFRLAGLNFRVRLLAQGKLDLISKRIDSAENSTSSDQIY